MTGTKIGSPRRRRMLMALAWLVAVSAILLRQIGCRLSCEDDKSWFWERVRVAAQPMLPFEWPARPPKVFPPDQLPRNDNNTAHVQIDFGGQWVQARMLATGHGRQLYHRHVQREIVEAAYPRANESLSQKTHDVEDLLAAFMGNEHPGWARSIRYGLGGFAGGWPGRAACLAEAERERATAAVPPRDLDTGIGGPLYPPLQALFFLPHGLHNDPLRAYFTHQYFLMGCTLLAALGIARFTEGRIAWPVAIVLLIFFTGTRPNFELGQNAPLTLCILVWGWVCRCRLQPLAGGVVWGLLAYKPVWAMSYFFALLLLREFRMAGAMVGTGVMLGLFTLPWVGVQSWFDWLKIGGAASELYSLDEAWIPLSRDLFGLPRRLLVDFRLPFEERFNWPAHLAGWLLWMLVVELTLRVFYASRPSRYREPFVLLAAWLLTYHFIYYDAAVAAFPFFALLDADRQSKRERGEPTPWLGFLGKCYAAMLLMEYALHPLNLKATVIAERYAHNVAVPGADPQFYPRLLITFDEWGPWNTLVLLVIWAWCGVQMLKERTRSSDLRSEQVRR